MLTVGQAYRRTRWYTALAWLIGVARIAFYLLSALKTAAPATRHYADWHYPLSWLGWAVQCVAVFLYTHAFKKPSLDVEVEAIKADKPAWVDSRARPAYTPLEVPPPIPNGYPNVAAPSGPLRGKFDTFHTMEPIEVPPGTTLYRVVDPASSDNNICWMTKAEFDKLKSKDDWRRRFAVWANWIWQWDERQS
jgi:hypothetical protein